MELERVKRERWLVSKSQQNDAVKLPSGLIYKKIRSINLGKSPVPKSTCICHYTGSLYSGEVFDCTYQREEPISTITTEVIPAWTEALQLMKEGEKWELYIPGHLAYGDAGIEDVIPPNNCPLKFILELVKIEGEFKRLSESKKKDETD